MIIHNFEQGSDEWQNIRLGKLTGSDFHTLLGNSNTKQTILYKKACERITGVKSDSDSFSSVHTERGHELENEARIAYEFITDNKVDEVGFIELDKFIGCSPDGLINNDGMIEIKCKDNHNHLKAVIKNYIDPQHKTQIQFNLFISGRKWCDYVLYNPNFDNPIHIIRIERDEESIKQIKDTIKNCNNTIDNIIKKFNEV